MSDGAHPTPDDITHPARPGDLVAAHLRRRPACLARISAVSPALNGEKRLAHLHEVGDSNRPSTHRDRLPAIAQRGELDRQNRWRRGCAISCDRCDDLTLQLGTSI